ncbi:MAG: AI-2E family transporter [Pseudomonadota bacterium]|nr:AI-2E family transporter [Pseudomonadota bacterium]
MSADPPSSAAADHGTVRLRGSPSDYVALVLGAAAAVVVLWFVYEVRTALLLLFFALVVTIALSAPVRWFMRRGLSHKMSGALTFAAFLGVLILIGALVFPRVAAQMVLLLRELPEFAMRFNEQLASLLARYPELQGFISADAAALEGMAPSPADLFRGLGGASLSLLAFLALLVVFLSFVLYALLDPVPILRGYLGSLPPGYRRAGARAFARASRAVIGWTKASLIIGVIEAVLVFIFLTLMEVPAALVWAALAFFAEFIPRIGGYVMAAPPVLISLTLGPMTALWVALFYLVMNEILGNLVAPRIRGATMQLHPVMLLFFTLAFALAFGVLGAIVATPAAAFFSAYYGEFYLKRRASAAR